MRVVDSHCHLDFEGMEENLPGVLQRAAEAGVDRMVSISSRVRRFDNLLRIANENANVFCTVGTHPHNAHEELDITSDDLVRLAEANPKCVGIGEVGLDYHYDLSPRAAQAQGFRTHIDAARRTGLPLVIHTRAAEDDTIATLAERAEGLEVVLHCFSMPDRLDECLERGWWISFAGNVTYPSARELRFAAAKVPEDRILVETDAPYLAPQPLRGKRNQPANVVETAKVIAAERGVSYAELERTVEAIAAALFGW